MVLVQKTIRARIVGANDGKLMLLQTEYANFQRALNGQNAELYSATRQQAERLSRRIGEQNSHGIKKREYPMVLRNDVYDIKKTDNTLSRYWIRIPVHGVRGGINLPIRPHSEINDNLKIREAKVFHHRNKWFVAITVQKYVEQR